MGYVNKSLSKGVLLEGQDFYILHRAGSSLLCPASAAVSGATLQPGCTGSTRFVCGSSCGARRGLAGCSRHGAPWLQGRGFAAPRHEESPRARGPTHVRCTGGRILHHWPTREVQRPSSENMDPQKKITQEEQSR